MRAFKVFLNGTEIDTIFWYGDKDTIEDIKKCLVDDGYDQSILLNEELEEYIW